MTILAKFGPDSDVYVTTTTTLHGPGYYIVIAALRNTDNPAIRLPINGPYDGRTFTHTDAGSCVVALEELRWVGYRVPQGLIDELAGNLPTAEGGQGEQDGPVTT